MREFTETIDEFLSQEGLTSTEGERGVRNLCRLVNALGYKDKQYFGQFHPDGSYGDLIAFLEDNPGCIEAIHEWIGSMTVPEWKQALEAKLPEETSDDE